MGPAWSKVAKTTPEKREVHRKLDPGHWRCGMAPRSGDRSEICETVWGEVFGGTRRQWATTAGEYSVFFSLRYGSGHWVVDEPQAAYRQTMGRTQSNHGVGHRNGCIIGRKKSGRAFCRPACTTGRIQFRRTWSRRDLRPGHLAARGPGGGAGVYFLLQPVMGAFRG